jgi:hypothetical protein
MKPDWWNKPLFQEKEHQGKKCIVIDDDNIAKVKLYLRHEEV